MAMLSHVDLELWYRRLGLSEAARALIDRIRSSEPVRRVGGGKSNVVGRYPSTKMGRTVQFESHRLEFAVAVELEDDATVLEYYDQPCRIPLSYHASSGRKVCVQHTPDFFVLRSDSAGWEECKTDEQLAVLAQKSPQRYEATQEHAWRCPPGEAYAASFALYYRIRPSSQVDWVLQRNLCFLDDYLRGDSSTVDPRLREIVIARVSALPGIALDELIRRMEVPEAADSVHSMIAHKEIYIDLKAAPLASPDRVRVFRDSGSALGFEPTPSRGGTVVDIEVGSFIDWDGSTWRVANVGDSAVGLVGARREVTELSGAAMERLIGEGRIVLSASEVDRRLRDAVHARLAAASERDLKIANRRFAALQDAKSRRTNRDVPARTLRSWALRYAQAEEAYGDGYVGLLPELYKRGNRHGRIPEEARALMRQSIDSDFGNAKQKSKYTCWIALTHACEQRGLAVPSYRAFRRALQKRSQFEQTLQRKGRRAAYEFEPPYWDLQMTTPRHGDRPFEIAHIDHTELDVELRCATTDRPLGRPWMTLLVDAFSRRILGMYLTFDPPSYRSCMMVLRDCVRRHARLPQVIVADGGREFESTYFETLLARYECTKKTRPPAKARFGSVCERLFGTSVVDNRNAVMWPSQLCGAGPPSGAVFRRFLRRLHNIS
jgi:transposase InsO family protein